jgi:hypothetical protein
VTFSFCFTPRIGWPCGNRKTTFNSYVLEPNDPNTLGGIDNIFGIRVVTSTQVPLGSAAVEDSKIAVNIFRRWGLEIMANP